MLNGLFYNNSFDKSITNRWASGLNLLLSCFMEMHVFNANGVDPVQMCYSAASDLCTNVPFIRF